MESTRTDIGISWATTEKSDALVPLLMALYKHDVPLADEPTIDEVKAHIAQLVDPATPHRLAIAWHGENCAIGLAAVGIFVSVSDPRLSQRKQAELKELFVLPDFRGQGIGAVLLDWIEEYLRSSDICRLDWHVKTDNHRGISFYESFGGNIVENRISMRKYF